MTGLSLADLAEANEENWREGFLEMLGRWERGETHVAPDLVWYRSDVPHPLLNGVLTCRFDGGEAEARVAAVLAGFRQRGLPGWWWLFPSTLPANLGSLLERQGLVREADLPGMALDLAHLPHDGALPEGLEVRRVASREGLARWAEVYAKGFPMDRAVAAAHEAIFANLGFGPDTGWRHYLGLYQGKPVATSSCYLGAGVAGLYYVSTLPEARGRGIGRAMVVTPLAAARRTGYRVGVLQATVMGRPLYQRLGFRDCIAFPQYRWG